MAKKKEESTTSKEYSVDDLLLLGLKGGDGDGEKKKPKRPMFYFSEAGLVVPPWAIITIELQIKWEDKPKVRPVYGIVMNRGLEPSQSCPIGERSIWYEREEQQKRAFNQIIETMDDEMFKVITL